MLVPLLVYHVKQMDLLQTCFLYLIIDCPIFFSCFFFFVNSMRGQTFSSSSSHFHFLLSSYKGILRPVHALSFAEVIICCENYFYWFCYSGHTPLSFWRYCLVIIFCGVDKQWSPFVLNELFELCVRKMTSTSLQRAVRCIFFCVVYVFGSNAKLCVENVWLVLQCTESSSAVYVALRKKKKALKERTLRRKKGWLFSRWRNEFPSWMLTDMHIIASTDEAL